MKTPARVVLFVVADPALARQILSQAAGNSTAAGPQLLASWEEARVWLDRAMHRKSPAETAVVEHPLLQILLQSAGAPASLPEEEFGEMLRHELNNPLTGILGNAELLLSRRNQLTPGAVARIESIADQALRLREAVRRLSLKLTKDSVAMKARS